MKLCDYGCGQEAKHPFKNGKWCCSEDFRSCPSQREKLGKSMKGKNTGSLSEEHKKKIGKANKGKKLGPRSEKVKRKISKSMKGKNIGPRSKEIKKKISESHKGKIISKETKRKMSKAKKGQITWNKGKKTGPHSKETKRKMSKAHKFILKDYKEKYPFFFKIEELRENKNGEIQGHCKNHNCENSKEKGGWFTPTSGQLNQRIQALENPRGVGECNFYCSQHCKNTCILFNLQSDPLKDNNLPYTPGEYKACRTIVMDRANGLCEYCGEPATHFHHIKPQKLEPFFVLDPDYCIASCKKCHYEKGHKDECSTGNLAKIVCSVESQKFLNQK